MKNRSKTPLFTIPLGAAVTFLVACAGSPGDAPPDEREQSLSPEGSLSAPTPVPSEVLNEFDSGGDRVSFLQVGGEDQPAGILMQAISPPGVQTSILERLQQQAPDLSVLEVFYAVAPEGEAPHPELVAAHPADRAIRTIEFDTSPALVDKSAGECTTYFRSQIPLDADIHRPNFSHVNDRTGVTPAVCAATNNVPDCLTLVDGYVAVAGCNEGPGLTRLGPAWRWENRGWQELDFPPYVAPGGKVFWSFAANLDPFDELFTPGKVLGIKGYGNGNSAVYHLRAVRERF